MATETHKPTEVIHEAPTPPIAAAAPVVPKGPRSYLVMMLLAVVATPTGLARAYRGEQAGWTRFWVFVGMYIASFLIFWVPLLNFVPLIGLLVLYIWGVVDVFMLRKTTTDSDGAALLTTPRDEKFAKAFYITFIVILILSGVGVVLSIILTMLFATMFINTLNNGQFNTPNSSSPGYNNNRSFEYYYDQQAR